MTQDAPLVASFVMGLFGSVHCLVMCGGIVGALSTARTAEGRGVLPVLLGYNLGRIASYAAVGALAATAVGSARHLMPLLPVQLALRALSALTILGAGLYLMGYFPQFTSIERIGGPAWRPISKLAGRLLPVRSIRQATLLGTLWGWLPCGLVYTALMSASAAGTTAMGALSMAAFGLGTLPTLMVMGLASHRVLSHAVSPGFRLGGGALVFALGAMQALETAQQLRGR